MSRAIALVPVKPLSMSKSRLSRVLSDQARTQLSARLLSRVLRALNRSCSIDGCWVIGGDGAVEVLATRHDCRWVPELGDDLNGTLACALQGLPADITRALILPMDLPFLTGEAVDRLMGRLTGGAVDVVIAPDRWGQGTNGLLQVRPFVLPLSFGRNSLVRHLDAAASLGLSVVLHQARELAFDLDTPADLAEAGLAPAMEQPFDG